MITLFSSYLLNNEILKHKEVKKTLRYQVIKDGLLDTIIYELEYLTLKEIISVLEEAYNKDIYYFKKDKYLIEFNLIRDFGLSNVIKYSVLPIYNDESCIYCLVKSNVDSNIINFVKSKFNLDIYYHVIPEIIFENLKDKLDISKLDKRFSEHLLDNLSDYIDFTIIKEDIPDFEPQKDEEVKEGTDNNEMLSSLTMEKDDITDIDDALASIQEIPISDLLNFQEEVDTQEEMDTNFISTEENKTKTEEDVSSNISTSINSKIEDFNEVVDVKAPNLITINDFREIEKNEFYDIINEKIDNILLLEKKLSHSIENKELIIDTLLTFLISKYNLVSFWGKSSNSLKLVKYLFDNKELTYKIEIEFLIENVQYLNEIYVNKKYYLVNKSKIENLLKLYHNELDKYYKFDYSENILLFPIFIKERWIGIFIIDSKLDFSIEDLDSFEVISNITEKYLEEYVLYKKQSNHILNPISEVIIEKSLIEQEETSSGEAVTHQIQEEETSSGEAVTHQIQEEIYTSENYSIDEEYDDKNVDKFNETSYYFKTKPIYIKDKDDQVESLDLNKKFNLPILDLSIDNIVKEKTSSGEVVTHQIQEEETSSGEAVTHQIQEEETSNGEAVAHQIQEAKEDVKIEKLELDMSSIIMEPKNSISIDIELDEFAPIESRPNIEINLTEEEVVVKNEFITINSESVTPINAQVETFIENLTNSSRKTINSVISETKKLNTFDIMDKIIEIFPGRLWMNEIDAYNFIVPIEQHGPILYYIIYNKDLDLSRLKEFFNTNDNQKKFYSIYVYTKIKDEDIIPLLINKITDRNVALVSIKALENHKNFKTYPRIKYKFESAVHSKMPSIMVDWITAIKILRDEFFVPVLIDALDTWKRDKNIKNKLVELLIELTKQDFDDSEKKWSKWWSENQYKTRKEWILDGLIHKKKKNRISSLNEAKKCFTSLYGYTVDLSMKELLIIIDKIKEDEYNKRRGVIS